MQAYGAAKAGLIGLTHAQAVSLAKRVRVNAVLPGWIYTMPDPKALTQEDHDNHLTGKLLFSKMLKLMKAVTCSAPYAIMVREQNVIVLIML